MDTDVLRNLKSASRAVCRKGLVSGLVGLLSLQPGCVFDWSHSPGGVLDASSAADGGSDADSESEAGPSSVVDADLADPDDAGEAGSGCDDGTCACATPCSEGSLCVGGRCVVNDPKLTSLASAPGQLDPGFSVSAERYADHGGARASRESRSRPA